MEGGNESRRSLRSHLYVLPKGLTNQLGICPNCAIGQWLLNRARGVLRVGGVHISTVDGFDSCQSEVAKLCKVYICSRGGIGRRTSLRS